MRTLSRGAIFSVGRVASLGVPLPSGQRATREKDGLLWRTSDCELAVGKDGSVAVRWLFAEDTGAERRSTAGNPPLDLGRTIDELLVGARVSEEVLSLSRHRRPTRLLFAAAGVRGRSLMYGGVSFDRLHVPEVLPTCAQNEIMVGDLPNIPVEVERDAARLAVLAVVEELAYYFHVDALLDGYVDGRFEMAFQAAFDDKLVVAGKPAEP